MGRRLARKYPLTHALVAAGCFEADPFVLVDVGVSRGVARRWNAFADQLRVIGFDPLVREVRRLRESHPAETHRFVAARLGAPARRDELADPVLADPVASKNDGSLARSSAAVAWRALDWRSDVFHQGGVEEVEASDAYTSLDAFCRDEGVQRVDFVKIDTDGHDLPVLLGAEATLGASPVLGVLVEAPFHGPLHPLGNTFANIDGFLRGHGFALFDLAIRRYSRAALPLPFQNSLPAQTTGGQVDCADALYLRDVASPHYAKQWSLELSAVELLKLACVCELHRLPDCAADLLGVFASRVDPLLAERGLERAKLLDALVARWARSPRSHAQYLRDFASDPTRWYPANRPGVLARWIAGVRGRR